MPATAGVAPVRAMDAPVIRPVNYLFDERSQSVVFRTADGSKFQAPLRSANAAFEIDGIDEGSRTGWSVIIAGITEEVRNPTDVRRLDRSGLEADGGFDVVAEAGDVESAWRYVRGGARVAAEPLAGPPDGLSEREVDVLRMIALGHTNAGIAEELYLSIRTVETHRAHIQQKAAARLTVRARPLRAGSQAR